MKKQCCLGLFLILVSILTNCTTADADETVRIGGTGVALGPMRLLCAAFQKENPHIKIRFKRSIGSSGAITSVLKGGLDVGLMSRQLKPEELELGLNVIEYAKTPFVFISGARVPVTNITTDELLKLYQRKVLTWPNGETIRIVLRPIADSDNIVARGISPAMSLAMDDILPREGMLIALTNQESLEIVSRTPGAFGFSTLTQVITEKHTARVLKYNGVTPSLKTLANGAYPLSHTLSIITQKPATKEVSQFINFVFSPVGAKILKKSGNIPLKKKQIN